MIILVIVMYDLEGKKIEIVTEDEIEVNRMDDLEKTIDLAEIISEVNKNE